MSQFSRKSILLAHAVLFGVALIYGSSFLIAKSAMQGAMPPRAFIQFRVTGAALLFWMLMPFSGNERFFSIPRSDQWRLAICAVYGVTTNMLFSLKDLKLQLR